jgi:hypothetical protein
MVAIAATALVIAIAACGPAPANEAVAVSDNQTLSAASAAPASQHASEIVWGRVPYCNCFGTAATANVSNALKDANLTVSLKEQSPHEGWLYFVVNFDPQSATLDQVGAAIAAGGGELVDGPP